MSHTNTMNFSTATFGKNIIRTVRTCSPDVSRYTLPYHLATLYRPGVLLENIAFENSVHRKLHIEEARLGMMHVVHSVMYPRPQYDAPILAFDLVTVGNTPVFGIADTCPVTDDLRLPEDYRDAITDLQTQYGFTPTPRDHMPGWGRDIFSDRCVIQRKGGIDAEAFCAYGMDLLGMHLEYCALLDPTTDYLRIRRNQSRFCRMQLKNDKTRSSLASAFGGDLALANEYMNRVMFDC